jgi:hypothetical protein
MGAMTEGHQLRLFNSLGRRIEDFAPAGSTAGIYSCGPTVYSFQHLGNMQAGGGGRAGAPLGGGHRRVLYRRLAP